jgi:tRNA-2-methylthio-N6-dimethylallyladenosine synthase
MAKKYEEYFVKPSIKDARKRKTKETHVINFNEYFNIKGFGLGKTYKIETFGCQGNEADSEEIKGILQALKFTESPSLEEADLILLNTCAIRENAENRVFGELGRLKKFKRNNPDLILGVCGCMPQEEKVVNKILTKIPHVDLVFGTHNIYKLPEYLESVILSKERVIEVYSEEGQIVENLPKIRENSKKAWVSIMFGCDEFCTYCIVPYTRGKERSRLPENIIQEVQELIDEGYQEVTLLGQNVNSYGNDFTDKDYRFKDLLNDLNKMDIPRVRFTTSHPKDFDEETVKIIAQGGNLMPYIHLPVQSGSNNILKRMNRKYTKETYLQLVKWIYKYIPNASLTTDIIVGFPGETEEEFNETLDLVEKCEFEGAYTFIFSKREGTPAG